MAAVDTLIQNTLNYYNDKAQAFVAGTVGAAFTKTQELFLAEIPKGGKILDFGCGSGRDTKYFLSRGYEVEATDGSKELCRLAGEYTGIPVKQLLFEELAAVEKYDGIWACASILHVAGKQLPDILKKMAAAVKKGGIVYVSFKYGVFEGMKNGRFFTYLTEEGFRKLLQDVPELAIEKCWISEDVRPERENEQWLNVILKKRP